MGLHMWGNSGFYFYDGLMLALPEDANLVVVAHDYLSMIYYDSSLRGRGRDGSLVLDLSGVSDSMDTRFYYSLRNVIGLVQSSYSFEEIRGIFFGGDYLFNTACMYHFQRMVGSVHSTGDVEKAVLSLVGSNRFWLGFLLHLKNDFYNYLPEKKRALYEGIVDKVSKLVTKGA